MICPPIGSEQNLVGFELRGLIASGYNPLEVMDLSPNGYNGELNNGASYFEVELLWQDCLKII